MADHLHGAGYETALIGKWHCGNERERPNGFDRWFVPDPFSPFQHRGKMDYVDQEKIDAREGYQCEIVTEEAVRFLRERDKSKPYFLFVGYAETHSPFENHPERLVDKYRNCRFDDIKESPRPDAYPRIAWHPGNEEAIREQRAQYYAAVSHIDEQVARICKEVEDDENTLTIYTSDHGLMCGQHDLWLKGNGTTPQNFLDESILVPCLLRWTERIAAGQSLSAPIDHCDLHATILDAAQVELDDAAQCKINSPGRSFLTLLDGSTPSDSWRDAQFCEYGNARMIRTANAKLIRRYPAPFHTDSAEYYDLTLDPCETHNRIHEPGSQESLAMLGKQIDEYFARYAIAEHDGRNAPREMRCNPDEPWIRTI